MPLGLKLLGGWIGVSAVRWRSLETSHSARGKWRAGSVRQQKRSDLGQGPVGRDSAPTHPLVALTTVLWQDPETQ